MFLASVVFFILLRGVNRSLKGKRHGKEQYHGVLCCGVLLPSEVPPPSKKKKKKKKIEDSEHPIQSKKKLTVRGAEMPLCMTLCVAILSWQHSSSILCRLVAFGTIYFIFFYIYILYFIFHFKTYIQTVFIRLKPETAYVLDFGYFLFRVDDGIIL